MAQYDTELLQTLKRIAIALENIEEKIPNIIPIEPNKTYYINSDGTLK